MRANRSIRNDAASRDSSNTVPSTHYHAEVERFERRKRWLTSAGVLAGSALLGFLLLWNAGVNPVTWFKHSSKQTSVSDAARQTAHQALSPPMPPPVVSGQAKKIDPLPGTDSSISKTPLALLLAGTLPGRNAFEGTAMIGVTRENMQTYAAGALLVNGARLKEIHDRYVVLERDGRSARLYLQDRNDQSLPKTPNNDLLTVGGPKKFKPAVATSVEPITDYIRPSPLYDGAILRGYQVYPGKRSGVFYQMGLKPGDVVTSINGAAFNDPAQAFEAFRQLMDGVALSATVNRNGKLERVTLDGAAIIADQERARDADVSTSSLRIGSPTT